MKRINQAEIAQASGVSVSTVSRVLSSAPGISVSVRERVMSIAREMGYRPPLPGLVRGPALSRVVLFVGALRNPTGLSLVYNAILSGVRSAAETAGIAVTFAVRNADGSLPEHIISESGAAFLFLGIDPEPELLRRIRARNLPVVLVNGLDPEMIVDGVSPSNFSGARLAARYLVEKGHKRILQLTHTQRWTLNRRSQGFTSSVHEFAGPDADVRNIELDNLDEESVYKTSSQWLSCLAEGYTAAFCGNDLVGLSMLQVLKGNGYAVPQDVAVMGFDDLPVATMADPTLTTIHIDWEGVGTEAMRLVYLRQSDPDAPPRHIQLGGRLVERLST